MEIAFITSTGRTGTDFFTKLFNDYVNNAWSLHEPWPSFRRRSYTIPARKHTLYEKYYFKIPRIRRHNKREEDVYVETNYHLANCIPLIRDAFPNAITIHIIRDGKKVVTSWLNRYRYITNDHITPYSIGDYHNQKYWKEWNPLQKLSWYWKTVNEYAYSKQPDLFLRFEDIFAGEKDSVFKILNKFSEIEYSEQGVTEFLNQKVNKTKMKFFPDYNEWPKHWKDQFWEIAGDTMQKFGYTE